MIITKNSVRILKPLEFNRLIDSIPTEDSTQDYAIYWFEIFRT